MDYSKSYKLKNKDLIGKRKAYGQKVSIQIVSPYQEVEVDENYSHIFGDPFKNQEHSFEGVLNLLCEISFREIVNVQDLWAYIYALIHYKDKYEFEKIEYIYSFSEESYKYGVTIDVFWRYKK